MPIETPSKKSVAKAGETLRQAPADSSDYTAAMSVLSDWRSLYAYPLNAFNVLLRKKCGTLGLRNRALVARRLKRTPSIVAKLKRFPGMRLSRMQDIGGLRVIVEDVEDVRRLHNTLLNSRMAHDVILPCDDYIREPKPDGYRSLHQVFRYQSKAHPELSELGLKIEVQIRTHVQHAWATAVEALGVMEKSAFKSGEGKEDFRRFFLLSSALLSILEGETIVEALRNVPPKEIVREFRDLEERLGVFLKIRGVAVSIDRLLEFKEKGAFCVMELDGATGKLDLWHFRPSQIAMAEKFYKFRELENRTNGHVDVVLVSVGDLKRIRQAYPNYFLDCHDFIRLLQTVCDRIEKAG